MHLRLKNVKNMLPSEHDTSNSHCFTWAFLQRKTMNADKRTTPRTTPRTMAAADAAVTSGHGASDEKA